MPPNPNTTRWLSTHHVEIQTVVPTAAVDTTTGVRPFDPIVVEQTHVFDANIQKPVLSEYKLKSKIKFEAYTSLPTRRL